MVRRQVQECCCGFAFELLHRWSYYRSDEPRDRQQCSAAVSVNRIIKGDRLPVAPVIKPKQHDSTPAEKPVRKPAMLGCEPAFSPFAEPTRAHIISHCLT